MIKDVKTETGWIAVRDEKPPVHITVLTVDPYGGVCTASFTGRIWIGTRLGRDAVYWMFPPLPPDLPPDDQRYEPGRCNMCGHPEEKLSVISFGNQFNTVRLVCDFCQSPESNNNYREWLGREIGNTSRNPK